MRIKILQALIALLLGYLLVVGIYFVFLVVGHNSGDPRPGSVSDGMLREYSVKETYETANYATIAYQAGLGGVTLEQKYERVATLNATTQRFDEDQQRLRSLVDEHHALIQAESLEASDGHQTLELTIGVPPAAFDPFVEAMRKIGQEVSFSVTKTDKTNEFLELGVQRDTLTTSRDAMHELKARGGSVQEMINLEREILELERKIRELGVELGQFDRENEFCTASVHLAEIAPTVATPVPYYRYFIEALQWGAGIYLAILASLFVGLLCLLLVAILVNKTRVARPDDAPVA